MAIRRREENAVEVDVGPFADIAFLLIIFFILTTTLMHSAGRAIPIPASEPAKEEEASPPPSIILTRDRIRYGSDADAPEIEFDALRSVLMKENFGQREDPQDRVVVVECRDDVNWEIYFRVISAISRAGGVVAILSESAGSS